MQNGEPTGEAMVEETLLLFAAVAHTFGKVLDSPPRIYTRSWLIQALDEGLDVALELESASPEQRRRCALLFELLKQSIPDS